MTTTSTPELEELTPNQATQMYLADKQSTSAEATVRSHRSRLGHFIDWCDENNIENLNTLSGRDLHRYKLWRQEDINKVTLKTQLDTLRVFIRFCESIDGVRPDLSQAVKSPKLDDGDNQREVIVEQEQAEQILQYLMKYEYCSIRHVYAVLLWKTGMRVGATRSIDVGDVHLDEMAIEVNHRSETETPIKNKEAGERYIAISEETTEVLRDWIENQRPSVTDDHGRTPLLATKYGRVHIETLRKYSYQLTRPCEIGHPCPHDRDPETCEATGFNDASKCPDSKSPHSWRRGHITHLLRKDTPKTVVSDRVNASPDVLEKHYNQMTEKEKMNQRRDYLSNI
jgi:site-specific recombinase XerD